VRMLWTRTATALGVLGLGFVLTASSVAAAPGDNSNAGGNGNGNAFGRGNGNGNAFGNTPAPGETPELSSLLLFGSGAAGAASYAVLRIRAGRRRVEDDATPVSGS
jgi:hypothetical protein